MRSTQGEGLSRRGKTPGTYLERARAARREPTEAEDRLWSRLRASRLQGWKFRQQVPIGPYRADFVCPSRKLIVEVDGSQHEVKRCYDTKRSAYLEREGYKVIRFWNNDVLGRTDSALEAILTALTAPLPAAARLSLSPEGEGKEESEE